MLQFLPSVITQVRIAYLIELLLDLLQLRGLQFCELYLLLGHFYGGC